MSKLEVLAATMNQNNLDKYYRMNMQTDAVFANQSDSHSYSEENINGNTVKMITTPYRGVGKNRNTAVLYAAAEYLLFADDDMKYTDGYEDGIINAFDELKDADIIIFGCDLTKNNVAYESIQNKIKRLNVFNTFKYPAHVIAARKKSIEKANIWFTQNFGGGTIYGSGEDSLFLKECLDKKLRIYSHSFKIGSCAKDESTWFKGYDEKYFYDKGALCAAMFPALKYFAAAKLLLKFKKLSALTWRKSSRLMLNGMKGFKKLLSYDDCVKIKPEKGK